MKLTDKGPIQPAPVLAGPAQHTAAAVQAWPGIIAATHWDLFDRTRVDGADFYVGREELGHIHLSGEAHLATSPALGAALVAAGLARPLRWGGAAYRGWTEFSIRTAADAAHATWLFELNYQRLRGRAEAELVAEVQERTAS